MQNALTMSPLRTAACGSLAFVVLAAPVTGAQEVRGERVRYEMSRATVVFETGAFSTEAMASFAQLVDRGITDIDTLLNHVEADAPKGPRFTFVVREDAEISRSFRRRSTASTR